MADGISLRLRHPGGEEVAVTVDTLVIAGWTGRDGAAIEAHIAELEAVGVMRRPTELVGRYLEGAATLPHGTAMFCGTLAVEGDIAPAGRFEFALEDPVLGRTIRHFYTVETLPAAG